MSRSPNKAADFLAAMRQSETPEPPEPPVPVARAEAPATVHEIPRAKPEKVKAPPRAAP
jgi:hypothetical protein